MNTAGAARVTQSNDGSAHLHRIGVAERHSLEAGGVLQLDYGHVGALVVAEPLSVEVLAGAGDSRGQASGLVDDVIVSKHHAAAADDHAGSGSRGAGALVPQAAADDDQAWRNRLRYLVQRCPADAIAGSRA